MIGLLATLITLTPLAPAAPVPAAPQFAPGGFGLQRDTEPAPAADGFRGGLVDEQGTALIEDVRQPDSGRRAPAARRGGLSGDPEVDPELGTESEVESNENASAGPTWSQTAGSITNRPTPPPDPNAPPEALSGSGQSLLFYEVHFGGFGGGTQTGYAEDFFVYAPDQTKPRPLLVVFHKYGVGHLDAWLNTDFFQEAVRKRWHIVAPLSASGVHLGSAEGQQNTEKVLEWAMANFNIDKQRIYGVGFSMGAGAVMNFAARHLDHNEYAFAAVVDHTGGIAHQDTYAQSPGTQFVFDFWFGDGSPGSAEDFKMARACLLNFHPDLLIVDQSTDLAGNLTNVAVKVTRAAFEPLSTAYLTRQCDILVSHLATLGGTVIYDIIPFFGHSWIMLDERETVDWLGVHRLKVPTQHATLADGDRRYYHYDVVQDAAGAFTPFTWDLDTTLNVLSLSETSNLAQLGVDMASAGLSAAASLELNLSTSDNFADEVVFKGWPTNPTAVHRDGVQQFVNWSYNATAQELSIQEFDGSSPHQWVITP